MIGEIRLDRAVHRLSTPALDDVGKNGKSKLPPPLEFKENPLVADFFQAAMTSLKKKPDFNFCFKRSIKDLSSAGLPAYKIPEIPNIMPKKPYAHALSHKFLRSCKYGDLAEALSCIYADPNVVYSYDNLQMTGLHWAALRSYSALAEILLKYHSIVDCIDVNHRTPLFLAAKKGNFEVAKILLENKADPTIPSNSKKSPIKVCKNLKIIEMLKKEILLKSYLAAPLIQKRYNY